jgi:hypothetical protein
MSANKDRSNFMLSPSTKEKLQKIAADEETSMSAMVSKFVREDYEKRYGKEEPPSPPEGNPPRPAGNRISRSTARIVPESVKRQSRGGRK